MALETEVREVMQTIDKEDSRSLGQTDAIKSEDGGLSVLLSRRSNTDSYLQALALIFCLITMPPLAFPPMPHDEFWPADANEAYVILRDMYQHSWNVLRREENEPIRLNILWSEIFSRAAPLLEAITEINFPEEWIETTAHLFGELADNLKSAETAADGRY